MITQLSVSKFNYYYSHNKSRNETQRKKKQCYSYYLLVKIDSSTKILPSIYICGALLIRSNAILHKHRSQRAMSYYTMHKRAMQYKKAIKLNKQYISHYNNNVTVHVRPCFVSHRFGHSSQNSATRSINRHQNFFYQLTSNVLWYTFKTFLFKK